MNYCGIYLAVVVNSNDPLSKNRAQLQIPQILGTATSNWATSINAITPPAVGSNVYAAFTGGNVSFPVYFSPTLGSTLSGSSSSSTSTSTTTIINQSIISAFVNGQSIVQFTWSASLTTVPAIPGSIMMANAAGGNITVVLPRSTQVDPECEMIVKRVDSSGSTVFLSPFHTETINGFAGTLSMTTQGQGFELTSVPNIGWVTR